MALLKHSHKTALLSYVVFAFFLTGCGHSQTDNLPSAVALTGKLPVPLDPWIITNLNPSETPALLWNGLVGIRIGADGRTNGQPAFNIDRYQPSGEEKILPIPALLTVEITVDGKPIAPTGNYKETLNMKTGLLTVAYDCGSAHAEVKYVMSPSKRLLASQWTMANAKSMNIIAGTPNSGTKGDTGLTESNNISSLPANRQPPTANPKAFQFQQVAMEVGRAVTPPPKFDDIAKEVAKEWAKRWTTDIEIDGPVLDQQRIHAMLFYLRSAIHSKGKMSISPFALSNAQYNGHVFWDADIWVLPALAMIEPDCARQIAKYRLRMRPAAWDNYQAWRGREAKSDSHNAVPARGVAMYPWESSVTGRETVPGPSRNEHHITGSVAWGLEQAAAFGLVSAEDIDPAVTAATWFARERSTVTSKGKEVRDVMSPDENHTGDNDLYTNLLFEWLENGQKWLTDAEIIRLHRTPYVKSRDATSFLTYDHDSLKGYKQAAAVLSIYPLQYPPAEKEARAMMERFADKVSKNGPAMTDSVHATIWARLGEKEKAYALWKQELDDFLKPPLLLFSEKRSKPLTYFATGAGGSLQTVLYGFLGFRLDSKVESGAAWSAQLGHQWLSVKPNLPSAWKSVRFRHFSVRGKQYDLVATSKKVSVTPIAAH